MTKIATRESYGNALAEMGDKYNFVVFDADLAGATKTGVFKKKFPDRHFDCGIAEGNMMTIAAGMATTGVPAFVSSFAMFAAGRAFEQARNSVAYPHLNVKIGATHAGLSVGEDGATHQCCEDLALMRVLPGFTVVNPCDDIEARAAVEAAIVNDGPFYLRFGRMAVPTLNAPDYKFELGKGVVMADGKDTCIFATGLMVWQALEARELLKAQGIDAAVVNIHTIKPIDRDIVTAFAGKYNTVFTAEEHSVIGGLGSAVAEVTAEACPTKVIRIGVNDVFGRSGKAADVLEAYGLSASAVAAKVAAALK